MERDVPGRAARIGQPRTRLGRLLAPYLLLLPGGLWLVVFFLVPLVVMVSVSLQTGSIDTGFRLTWHFAEYVEVVRRWSKFLLRSVGYAGAATAITLIAAYPLAYWIAFHGGRRKSTFLFLLLLPFFVSFVIRTLAWQFILSDEGILLGTLKDWGILPGGFRVLATAGAVIAGIAYNFLPFMALPLYVSLEKIDRSMVEAARDLYANRREVFLRVIFPLSLPGVFAGVLLTFVPAVGDFVNASILGGVGNTMIGNIIQTRFLVNFDYPGASALSVILMAGLLIGIYAYARVLGMRNIQEYV